VAKVEYTGDVMHLVLFALVYHDDLRTIELDVVLAAEPLIERCDRGLDVDSRAGARKGSGDIAIPLKKKILRQKDIQGDLFELCRGKVKGRRRKDEITLFKSTGLAIEDLAAAMLVWRGLSVA